MYLFLTTEPFKVCLRGAFKVIFSSFWCKNSYLYSVTSSEKLNLTKIYRTTLTRCPKTLATIFYMWLRPHLNPESTKTINMGPMSWDLGPNLHFLDENEGFSGIYVISSPWQPLTTQLKIQQNLLNHISKGYSQLFWIGRTLFMLFMTIFRASEVKIVKNASTSISVPSSPNLTLGPNCLFWKWMFNETNDLW